MARNKQRTIAKRLTAAVLSFITALSLLPWDGELTAYAADTSSPIALKRTGGSGEAFIYHSFAETTEFKDGVTYAFLDGIYSAEDAVSALGAGAILEALDKAPVHGGKWDTDYYLQKKYGSGAKAKVYVSVVTPGKDFDTCPKGGLYQVPNTSNPTEYRYFCWKGGAYNCGPYYAYTYVQESITYNKVSASLNSIEKQGSTDPKDYTVSITYNGNLTTTLDSGSYTVQFTAPNAVTFVISDSVGNSVTAKFQSPLAVRYDGNAEGVSGVPATQAVWKGSSVTLSATKPTRSGGYTFQNWKVDGASTTYSAGTTISPTASLKLLAQWKDTQKPTVAYSPTQVMTGDSDDSVKKAVQAALTITDNEPVSECTTTITLPADCTKTPGNKSFKVTVKDKAGNMTEKDYSVYVNSYVSFGTPTFTESTTQLNATLTNPGTDTVTASGFVWGVMNSPTLAVNNGTAKTTSVVSTAGGTISVEASDLQKGVKYYARAYITAGGITYYSDEIEIGLALPQYGTFTIKHNKNNTFTITRSDGSEGTQNVTYRTVNGSAVGGTHFKHKVATLAFKAGETSKTITITEYDANTAYSSSKPATAYSNEDRTYSVEIYRVTGGGSLGSTTKATRTMTNDSSYTIDGEIYSSERSKAQNVDDDNNQVIDRSGGSAGDLYWRNNRGYNQSHNQDNFNTSANVNDGRYSGNEVKYIEATGTNFLYRYTMNVYEYEDAWAHAWMGTHEPNNAHSNTKCGGSYTNNPINLNDSEAGEAIWTAVFEAPNNKEDTKNFPTTGTDVTAYNARNSIVAVDGTCYAKLPIGGTVYNFFGATGKNSDKWEVKGFTDYIRIDDTREPQLVAVAPMAAAWYKPGDTFVVSLIFDEIVDSQNSTLSSVSVNTTWGTAKYTGGADTNVLYFTGEIAENTEKTTLTVNSITNPNYIKDMCSTAGTATSSTVSQTAANATLKTGKPSFTVVSNGITNGTGKATIKVTETQKYTTDMSYAWSDSTTVPASGWVTLTSTELTTAKSTSGLTLSIRKEAGSGASNGKWYLHVKGVYGDTGYTTYGSTTLDFGTAADPKSTPPSLTVTVDNTNWDVDRVINYSYTPATGTLKYRIPGSTTWTTATNKTQASFTKNGYYTFMLTAGDETITKTVLVEKIDRTAPTASVGEPTAASVESPKEGVYTKLVLPVTYSDAESGVKTVQYAWTNSTITPSSWTTLATGVTTVTYTATESTQTTKYLHVKVTDNVGLYKTACSRAYTVISENAVKSHTPTITLTGNPTAWQNDTATLTWTLSNYTGKDYEVTLPNGKTSTDSNGETWARQNGTYTVTVRDLEYGGENSATVTVTKLDFDPPTVTVSGIKDGWSTGYEQTMTVTASDGSGSGAGEMYYAIVSTNTTVPTDLNTFTKSVTVDKEGEYYIYWRVYDNAGDDSDNVKREGNYTEGFQPVQIDQTAPTVSFGTYSADDGLPVTASDATSKLKSVTYSVFNSITKETKNGTVSVSGMGSKAFAVPANMLLPGDNEVTVTAYDNAGKSTTRITTVHVTVISVDITWGAMAFTYSDGTWSPETHDYDGRGWTADSTDGDRITVTNSGEAAVSVTYRYTPTYEAVTGSFTDGTDTVTEVTLPTGGTKSAQLCLSGKPSKALNSEKIGSVTVTIGGE